MKTEPQTQFICFLITALLLSSCKSGTMPGPTLTPGPPIALTIPGIVLYYPFNGNANDMSGNQNNGQVHGATLTTDRFGISNSAYYFDGVDDYISFDATEMPLGNTSRTISAWIKAESWPPAKSSGLGSRATVIGWGLDNYKQLSEMQIVNKQLQFHNYFTDNTNKVEVETNKWYYLVIVFGDGAIYLYINGNGVKGEVPPINTIAGSGKIGAFPDPSNGFDNSYFHGIIDDISVYNQALSEAQIKSLYTEDGWGR